MVDSAYRWAMERAIETTQYAHKNGLEAVFSPVDFSRAELKWASLDPPRQALPLQERVKRV